MGKSHRDNHRARKKRGPRAFKKKAARRAVDQRKVKCKMCGVRLRPEKTIRDCCPSCASL